MKQPVDLWSLLFIYATCARYLPPPNKNWGQDTPLVRFRILTLCNCYFFVQELIAKDIDAADLDFSRYGDTFFEVTDNSHL
jgi:hypothetical protein